MKFIVVNFISPRKFLSPIEVNHHIFGNHTAPVQGYQVVPHGELISKIPPFPPYIFFRRARFQDFRAVTCCIRVKGWGMRRGVTVAFALTERKVPSSNLPGCHSFLSGDLWQDLVSQVSGPLTLTGGVYRFPLAPECSAQGAGRDLVPLSTKCHCTWKSYWHQACALLAAACTSTSLNNTPNTSKEGPLRRKRPASHDERSDYTGRINYYHHTSTLHHHDVGFIGSKGPRRSEFVNDNIMLIWLFEIIIRRHHTEYRIQNTISLKTCVWG